MKKIKSKKIGVIAILLTMLISMINLESIKAVDYKPNLIRQIAGTGATLTSADGVYTAWWSDGVFKTDVLGKSVFCIEPFVVGNDGTYYKDEDIPVATRLALSKIVYYGWDLSPQSDMDYAATQYMIWEYWGVKINWDSRATNFANNIYPAKKAQINAKIAKHNIRPTFHGGDVKLKIGESITVNDTNGVFNEYQDLTHSSNVQVTKSGNSLTIKALAKGNVTITGSKIKAECIGSSVAYRSGSGTGQDVGLFKISDPLPFMIDIKISEPIGDLDIAKKDSDGNLIANTQFKLSKNADMSSPIGTYTTASNGKVSVDNLVAGTYYIQETSVPSHLELDSTIRKVTISDGQTTTYTATNNFKRGDIEIAKKDTDGNFIANTQFKLSRNSDMSNSIGTYTTASNGKVTINDLKIGKYYVQEVSVPGHLILDGAIKSVDVKHNQTATYTATNKFKRGDIEIAKKDTDGNFIANTQFKLSRNANMSSPIGTYTTASNGKVTIDELKIGKYYVQEVSVPGHLILDSTIKSIDVKHNQTATYTATNKFKRGDIVINKYDTDNNLVPNTVFVLSTKEDFSSIMDTYTTDEKGTITIADLKIGTYYLKEISTEGHLVVNSDIIKVEVNYNETSTVDVINSFKRGNIEIAKKDTDDNFIADTTFKIASDKDMIDVIGEYTTNEDGVVTIDELKIGIYYIQEVSVPGHLVLDNTVIEIEVKENKISSYTAVNEFKVEDLIISKKDIDGNLIPNTTFAVYKDKDGKYLIGVYTTGEDGTVTVKDIRLGTYYVKELKAPNHLIVDDKIYEVELTEDGENSFTSINEFKLVDLVVEKVAKSTGKKIMTSNFVFALYEDKECTKLIKEITGENGEAIFTDLKYGTYYLKEIKAPKGYKIDSEVKIIVIGDNYIEGDDGLKYVYVMPNRLLPAIVQTGVTEIEEDNNNSVLFFGIGSLLLGSVSLVILNKKRKV